MSKKLLFLLSTVLFLSFIFFSYLVAKESFVQLDFDTTVKFQDRIPRQLDFPFSTLSILGMAEVTGLIWLVLIILALIKRYFLTVLSMTLFMGGLAIELFGKLFVLHPGPPHLFYRGVIKFNFPTHYVQTDFSYPSGHVYRISFLIAFVLVFSYFKLPWVLKLAAAAFLIPFWVAMIISRIYLGEHWTTDVIGGALLGTSFGILTGLTIPTKKARSFKQLIDSKLI